MTTSDEWGHLLQYGYAPGDYMSRCLECGDTPIMDKRASTCRPCAEKMHGSRVVNLIGNLLAVIHRDGGQYLAEHGVEKACADAEAAVAKWIMTESSIDAMIEQAALAEREACALVCDEIMESIDIAQDGFGPCCENIVVSCADAIRERTKQ